jgi:hypothetical protein
MDPSLAGKSTDELLEIWCAHTGFKMPAELKTAFTSRFRYTEHNSGATDVVGKLYEKSGKPIFSSNIKLGTRTR